MSGATGARSRGGWPRLVRRRFKDRPGPRAPRTSESSRGTAYFMAAIYNQEGAHLDSRSVRDRRRTGRRAGCSERRAARAAPPGSARRRWKRSSQSRAICPRANVDWSNDWSNLAGQMLAAGSAARRAARSVPGRMLTGQMTGQILAGQMPAAGSAARRAARSAPGRMFGSKHSGFGQILCDDRSNSGRWKRGSQRRATSPSPQSALREVNIRGILNSIDAGTTKPAPSSKQVYSLLFAMLQAAGASAAPPAGAAASGGRRAARPAPTRGRRGP